MGRFGSRYAAAMRTRIVLPALLIVLFAACGGGSPAASGNPPAASQTAATQPSAASTPAGNGGTGAIDCTKLKAAAAQLLMVQFLAQLKDADTIAQVKARTIGNLDLDAFLAAMQDLHALDSVQSPFGDAKASIAVYEKAARAAKVLFATDPMTQAAIDTYNENVGTLTDFLGHQVAISGAMDAAGC